MKVESRQRSIGKKAEAVLDLIDMSNRIGNDLSEIKSVLCDGYGDQAMEDLIGNVLTSPIPDDYGMEILRLCRARMDEKEKESAR